jgi:hypothetical protein
MLESSTEKTMARPIDTDASRPPARNRERIRVGRGLRNATTTTATSAGHRAEASARSATSVARDVIARASLHDHPPGGVPRGTAGGRESPEKAGPSLGLQAAGPSRRLGERGAAAKRRPQTRRHRLLRAGATNARAGRGHTPEPQDFMRVATLYFVTEVRCPGVSPAGIALRIASPVL